MNPAIIAAIISAIGGIAGAAMNENTSVDSTSTTTTPSRMDPLYAILSPYMLGQAVNTGQNMSGWGGSQLFGWNPLYGNQGMTDSILAMLAQNMPSLINTYSAAGGPTRKASGLVDVDSLSKTFRG